MNMKSYIHLKSMNKTLNDKITNITLKKKLKLANNKNYLSYFVLHHNGIFIKLKLTSSNPSLYYIILYIYIYI